ncbi:MAG: acyl-CoA dehydrogenase family protein, partial [Pseudomonadales bacterium]|nr:acyl-CoA dehydrogenase family protein [Pseudomonadales bacterium]
MMEATLLERAATWAPQLAARSDEFEKARRLPADIADGFRDSGFFHMLVPKEFGGYEVHPSVFSRVLTTLSAGDGSAGWNVMIGATTGLLAASLPEEDGLEIYGRAPG